MTTIDGTSLYIIYNVPRSIYESFDGSRLYENDSQTNWKSIYTFNLGWEKRNQIIVELKKKMCFSFGVKLKLL